MTFASAIVFCGEGLVLFSYLHSVAAKGFVVHVKVRFEEEYGPQFSTQKSFFHFSDCTSIPLFHLVYE